jgi:hypothetical protein
MMSGVVPSCGNWGTLDSRCRLLTRAVQKGFPNRDREGAAHANCCNQALDRSAAERPSPDVAADGHVTKCGPGLIAETILGGTSSEALARRKHDGNSVIAGVQS